MGKPKKETNRDAKSGNTKSSSLNKQSVQLVHWFFTWNNYPNNGIEMLETRFREICNSYTFQPEIGEENGTPHIQGCISLKHKMRWSEFNLPRGIHWEKTKDNEKAIAYCLKEKTNAGLRHIWPPPPKPVKIISELRPWQKSIEDIILQEPDDRKIYWFWESAGNFGKSAFTKYLVVKHNALFCCGGKYADLINLVFNNNMDQCSLIVFDIPRNHGGAISYDTLECIKNGIVCNTKYETGVKVFNPPHVVVFANAPPNEPDKLSEDRWIITELK